MEKLIEEKEERVQDHLNTITSKKRLIQRG
jgi:hypothetical protein